MHGRASAQRVGALEVKLRLSLLSCGRVMQREALHDEHRCNKVMHACYCDGHTEHRIIVPFTQTYEKYPFVEWNGM